MRIIGRGNLGVRVGLILCGGLICWQLLVVWLQPQAFLLPSPGAALAVIIERPGFFLYHSAVTIAEMLAGMALACVVGFASACLLARWPGGFDWAMPVLVVTQAMPVFALAPLLVLWLGYGMGSKIAMAALIIYFPVTANLLDGLRRTPRAVLDIAGLYRLSSTASLFKLRLPCALPQLASGLRVAAVSAPIGAVVGEWVGASAGLGFVILHANARMQAAVMFAALLVLAAVAIVFYYLVDAACRAALVRLFAERDAL